MQSAIPIQTRNGAFGLLKRLAVAGAGLLLAILGQQAIDGSPWGAVLLFLLAIALFLAAFPRGSEPLALGAAPLFRSRLLVWLGLIGCAAAVSLSLAALPDFAVDKPPAGGWTLHLAAVAAVVAGGLLLDLSCVGRAARDRRRWWPWLAMLALVAFAAALRLLRLDSLPFGIWYDEAENALAAQSILRDPSYRPFYLGSTFHTAHYNYLVAAAFDWLGESIRSARLVSALMGLLMVPAAYLVAYELFWTTPSHAQRSSWVPPVMGVLFAALLAASAWALNFSRIAVNYTATPLFVLLATGFLLRGLRTQRLRAYLWSGLALGLGLNFYSSFRLFVPVLPLFVLAAMITRRDLWARSWRGLLLLALAALVVAAPLLSFAATNSEVFLARSRDTYLLKDAQPEQRLTLLAQNARTHLLMFNVRGDPNGRHNLPGRPMLDPVLAAFFVVGAAVCLWRWRRAPSLLLLIWLGLTLLGGILTLSFEAPQSLRSNGAMPAAYLIALVPVAEMLRAWERSDGGRYAPRVAPAAAASLVVFVAGWNVHQFFVVQQRNFAVWNAFSTAETLAGRTLAALNPNRTSAYLVSYYAGHPTVHFLAPQWRERYHRLQSTDVIPLVWPASGDVWLFIDPDSRVLLEQLRAIYPTAAIHQHAPPFGGPVTMHQVRLTRAVIESVQGLAASYYSNNTWDGQPAQVARVPAINADWEQAAPLPLPFSVEYEGVLRATAFGEHSFRLLTPSRAELLIDEARVLAGTGELSGAVTLAQGNHTLRLRAVGGPGLIQLAWRPPDREIEVLPTAYLFTEPVTANGLLGRFFPNAGWQPPAALATIDPQINITYHITPINRPFTVEWSGKLAIPEAGAYLFSVQAIDKARVEIDGQLVASALASRMTADGGATLEAGLHDIRVLYTALSPHSRINLYWTPPGGARAPIPSAVLFPPLGSYDRVEVPSFAMLTPPAPAGQEVVPAGGADDRAGEAPLDAEIRPLLAGLGHPTGVAAGAGGRLYVADASAAQVMIVGRDGAVDSTLTAGDEPFQEPFDVAIGPNGTLFVLDAAAAAISIFDADGDHLRTLRPDVALVARSRGLHVDADGRIWIANTPGQRVLLLNNDGSLAREIPVWPGRDAQVVDVVTTATGRIFVTALGVDKLIELDAAGRQVNAWDIPTANTMDGPHLAADASGAIYITQPEEGRIAVMEPDGARRGFYQVPLGSRPAKPVGIALGEEGSLFVTDAQGGRVVEITPE